MQDSGNANRFSTRSRQGVYQQLKAKREFNTMRSLFASSASPSRAEKQDSEGASTRRSFAFMKYSPKTSTPSSMRRTREHARQIALQVSTAAPDVPEEYFPPQSPQFGMDLVVERQASAFHNKPVIHSSESKNRLDRFVERQQGPNGRKPLTNASPSAISVDTSVSSRNSRAQTVQSMPTFPSNSTMQSVNVSRRQTHNVLDEVPVSPYPLNHSKSFGSTGGGSIGSGGKSNHLVNYSQTSRANIDPGGASTSTRGGASTNSTVTSSPATSVNVFTEGNENGFTFDAFGLDAYTVDQEVSLAMKEIAGEWGDEFPVQSFDSPHGSRSPSPPQDEDGFEDGFRLELRQLLFQWRNPI